MNWRELRLSPPDELKEGLFAALYEVGCQGINETDDGLLAYFPEDISPETITATAENFGVEAELRDIEEQDWYAGWKETVRPFSAAGFTICPPWSEYDPSPDERVIILDPGQAFGTGDHVTTQTVIDALRVWLDEQKSAEGRRFLDLGTGTGIISIAAAFWGIEDITAVDNETPAVETAAHNFELNDLSGRIRLLKGSIGEVGGGYDFIAANIFQEVLIELLPETVAALNPGGTLAVSGLLTGQEQKVILAAISLGLIITRVVHASGWVSVVFKK